MAKTDTSPAALGALADEVRPLPGGYRIIGGHRNVPEEWATQVYDTLRARAAEKEAGASAPDGWIPWGGGSESPVADGKLVTVRFRSGSEGRDIAMAWAWQHGLGDADIIAYRIAKEG